MSGKKWIRNWLTVVIGALGVSSFLTCTQQASAQLDVDFKLAKDTFIAHEPIIGELTIVNRAGRDLVLAGKNGTNWLDYRITDSTGRMLTPSPNAAVPKPIILKAGQVYKKPVVVNQSYAMGKTGMYRLKPTIMLSQINRVFTTAKNETINIVEGQKMWSQVYGVPPGRDGEGSFREFALLTQHYGSRRKTLYIRVTEVATGLVTKSYAIGDYLGVRPPEKVVDRQNQLHVFHMSGPKAFHYTIIDVDGKPIDQQIYVVKGTSVPQMVQNANGEIAVIGGMTLEESQETYESREFRNLSERPPGLPVF